MTTERDPMHRLSELPTAIPSMAHDERVRARCHALLGRRTRGIGRFRQVTRHVVDGALILAATIYAAAAALDALRLAGGP